MYKNITFIIPHIKNIKDEKILDFEFFRISYNKTLNHPNYCSYKLSIKKSLCNSRHIKNKIKYGKLQFDNGHMIPKADIIDCSPNIMYNIIPQYKNFNQGIWKNLEHYIRKKYYNHYILTVPEYNLNNYLIIDNIKLYIADGFYKIIYDNEYNLVYNIYLEHNNNKNLNFKNNGNYNKIPYFI